MNDIIAKISSYDIFTNLIPGAVFVFFLSVTGIYTVDAESVVGNLVIYYFTGLIISRIGSVFVEPVLKLFGIIKYNSYSDFITASAKDAKILVLLEASNLFRAILALLLVCLLTLSWDYVAVVVVLAPRTWGLIALGCLLLLFLLAYRKQNEFIRKRVEHHKDQ
ncbi:hypothetical protein [Rhizobium ruizarguesonis]|uniref:hypothetical protein n=1 Tax=Rhizobium ruizarguesonis TaxID=2081791 RepID=UPI0037235CF5